MRQRNRFSKRDTPQELREQHKLALALLDLHDEIARKAEREQEGC